MTDRRLNPRGLQPSATEPATLQTVGGVAIWVAATLAVTYPPLISVVGGSPSMVFDTDGQVVYTKGTP